MKLLCERCGHLNDTSSLSVQDGVIRITCGRCGQDSQIPAGIASASKAAPGLSLVRCPKCFHRQVRDDFCTRCGLDLHWAAERNLSFDPSTEGKEEQVQEAQRLWSEVMVSPRVEPLHEAFVAHCTEHGLLELALRRYREHLSDHPDDPIARRYCTLAGNRLEKLALAMLEAERWTPLLARRIRWVRIGLLVVAAILFLVGIVLAVLIFTRQPSSLPSAI